MANTKITMMQPYLRPGFWHKKENKFWEDNDTYSDKARKELEEWANSTEKNKKGTHENK